MQMDRRHFVGGILGGGAAAAWFPAWAQPVSPGIVAPLPVVSGHDITLRIARQTMRVDGKVSRAIGINGTVPAPLVRLKEGQTARLTVVNDLDEDSSIHWHGLILPFQMYGAALWLVWVFARQTGSEALALILAAGLLLALGLTLWGWRQIAKMSGRRALGSTIGAALSLLAGLGVAASATLLAPDAGPEAGSEETADMPWTADAVAAARAQGKVVFVNFTADWCVTCKVNERAALANAGTRALLAETGTLYMVADWTRRDDRIARELERFGRSGVPLYLVYAPGKEAPEILPQLLTPGIVADALKRAAAGREAS
jgi:hypothetical protein